MKSLAGLKWTFSRVAPKAKAQAPSSNPTRKPNTQHQEAHKPNLYTDRTTRRCWTTETGKQPLKSTNGMGNQPARRPVQVPVDIAGHFLGLAKPTSSPPSSTRCFETPTFRPPVPPLPSIQETWRNPPFQQPTPLPGLLPIPPTIQKPQRPAMFQCPVPPPMPYPIPQLGLDPNHNTMQKTQIPLMFQHPVPLPMTQSPLLQFHPTSSLLSWLQNILNSPQLPTVPLPQPLMASHTQRTNPL